MLKLLRVIHSINPEVGGPPEGILQISPLLSSYGIETTVACLDEPHSEWLINKPYNVISLGKGFGKLSDSDKKVFINTLMYNVGLAETVNEGKGVDKIMKMADDYSYGKIAGKTVDVMTAKLFQAAYNKAPQKAKDKVDKMNEKQLYIFMMNLWKRFGKQVRLGS